MQLEYCEYSTGIPHQFVTLLVGLQTNGDYVQFYSNESVRVDWGNGKWLVYPGGIVYGRQLDLTKPIIITSYEEVTKLTFGTQSRWDRNYREIFIAKAPHLVSVERLCYRLEELTSFKFFGNNQIENFESAWEDCTELVEFEGMDTTRAVTFKRAWKNCNKLTWFPTVYSKECLTVEEAWMGCTSMLIFPNLDVSNCENFNSAWKGNENLHYFPYIDTGAGLYFNHTWDYCTDLTYFPALDFSKALSMNFTFAYMKAIRNMPIINSAVSKEFFATFKQMCSLKCIAGINTFEIIDRDHALQMFDHTPSLIQPGDTEQDEIMGGTIYLNDESCYYDAGRSIFFVHIELIELYCLEIKFKVNGGDFEIDWGDNNYLHYNEGEISNIPIGNNGINIRSEEVITSIEFFTDVMTKVEFKRARTLTSVSGMLQNFKALKYFEILGPTLATDYSDVLNGCVNLIGVGEIDLRNAVTVARLFRNCELIEHIGLRYYDLDNDIYIYDELDMSLCLIFDELFNGCRSIKHIQKCITPIGESFISMYANTDLLACIDAINTTNYIPGGTVDMFFNTPVLVRPTTGEQAVIINGSAFDNGGNCGGPVAILFRTLGPTTFQLDDAVTVDWGDGNFIEYEANTPITGTQSGDYATILGEGTTIDWTPGGVTEIVFVRVENFTSMNAMFEGHTQLTQFGFIAESFITDYTSAFKGSGLVGFVAPLDLTYGILYTGMFQGTANLDWVTAMNTVNADNVEYMFADSGLKCLQEINTLKAHFPPSYLECLTDLDCSEGSEVECYLRSTMFDNSLNIVSPSPAELELILHHAHWEGTVECRP